ncbi:MAG: helix-turn-helix transcriptional regulator [Acidimicrobiales bacterium]
MKPARYAASKSQTAGAMSHDERSRDHSRLFPAAMTALVNAFGDPTRREIFLYLRSNPGMTVSQIADAFSLHPNVARHHLDRLGAGGYVRGEVLRNKGVSGRPSRHFYVTGDDSSIELLSRRDDLLVNLLREALARMRPDEAEEMAAKVGEEYGRSLAYAMSPSEGQRSVRAAMHYIADALTAHGFAAHAEDRGDSTSVVSEHCPFGDAANDYPVLCAVERGMISGLLKGLCRDEDVSPSTIVLTSRARGDDICAASA